MKTIGLAILALAAWAAVPAGADEGDADAMFLEMASGACNSDDFAALLWPLANSAAVRDNFSAPTIATGQDFDSRTVSRAAYLAADDFPIVMIDHGWFTSESFRRFEAAGGDSSQLVPVAIEINTAQDERKRVDWAPGRFEADEGDGPGRLIEKTGPGGYLLFSPTRDCWQLTGDIREARAAR